MKITFLPPNFECQVSKEYTSGKKKEWVLCYAPDEDHARELLKELNFEILQVRPHDFETGWRRQARKELKKAAAAIRPVVLEGRKPLYSGENADYEFVEKLWKKLRVHVVWLFHNKCAYCQIYLGTDIDYCQVEHYRPKGAIDGKPGHPGYWWLAYEPTNYLPSCKICNGYIKENQFPMMEGSENFAAFTVDLQDEFAPVDLYQGLGQEQPVIINPYQEDPSDYLDFVPVCPNLGSASPGAGPDNSGIAIPKNDRALKVIDLMKLNKNTMLVNRRRKAQQNVLSSLTQALSTVNGQALRRIIQDIKEGNQEFYSAAKAEVQAYYLAMGFPDPFK